MTYRVLVSTDLGGNPDDIQSLYRLIHYSDVLKVEGITSCTGPGSEPSAGLIRHWVQRVDVEHLRGNGYPELMSEVDLLEAVVQGTTTVGGPGPGKETAGSRKIIERALVGPDEVLWVRVCESITDVAQALHDGPDIASRIRVNYIRSSNTVNDPDARDYVYAFMSEQYPELWWIENGVLSKLSRDTLRGIYQTGEQGGEWGNIAFIEENIRGRGTDHDGLFDEVCGDAFPAAGWPEGSLKEGDSPTLLHLLPPVFGGVGNVDDSASESWGGGTVLQTRA